MPRHQMRNPRKPRKYSSDAYLIGFDAGYNLVKDMWQSGVSDDLDEVVAEAYEVESNSRQFESHPFYDFRVERQFDDYEEGLSAGIEEFVMENTL